MIEACTGIKACEKACIQTLTERLIVLGTFYFSITRFDPVVFPLACVLAAMTVLRNGTSSILQELLAICNQPRIVAVEVCSKDLLRLFTYHEMSQSVSL